jgi:hypothetical protein
MLIGAGEFYGDYETVRGGCWLLEGRWLEI